MPDNYTIDTIKELFHSKLKDKYPANEIRSIFYLSAYHVLKYSKTECIARNREIISGAGYERFQNILTRLEKDEPVQYVLGYTEFYGLRFIVDKNVLVPRQETEELVNLIIRNENAAAPSVLDIGTGSGCIAVTLKKNLPSSEVHACDISLDAIHVALINAHENAAEVKFFIHDITSPAMLPDFYDAIVSNPPYVRLSERDLMHRNVLDHEPANALFVPDEDPLLFYRHIAEKGMTSLKTGGRLYLEINENFPHEIKLLLEQAGYTDIHIKEDLNGKPRIAYAVRI